MKSEVSSPPLAHSWKSGESSTTPAASGRNAPPRSRLRRALSCSSSPAVAAQAAMPSHWELATSGAPSQSAAASSSVQSRLV
jgi:hypothetical protein